MIKVLKRLNIFSENSRFYTFVILFLAIAAGFVYFYLSPKYYKTYTSIQITSKDIQTQMDIIRSRKVVKNAVESLGTDKACYTKNLLFKKEDLYGHEPFRVVDLEIKNSDFYDKEIIITPLNQEKYLLKIKEPIQKQLLSLFHLSDSKNYNFEGEFFFSKKAVTPYFSFVLQKSRPVSLKDYYITFYKKDFLIDRIRRELHIYQSSKNSSLIKVEYQDSNPKRLKDMLNGLIKSYISQKERAEEKKTSKMLFFIENRLKDAKLKESRALDELRNYQKENHINISKNISSNLMQLSIGYGEELRKIGLELNTLSMIKDEIKKGNFTVISALDKKYPELASLAKEIQVMKNSVDKLNDLNPEVILVNQKIDKLKESMNSLIKNMQKSLYAHKNSIKKALKGSNKDFDKLPKNEQKLYSLEQNYQISKKHYAYLLKERSRLLNESMPDHFDISVIDPAVEVDKAFKPDFWSIMGLSLLAALALSVLLALINNKEGDTINSEDDLKKISKLPVYGMIPYVTDHRLYNKIYVIDTPLTVQSEAFRGIRTNIEYVKTDDKCKVITVTSTIPGEGKSVVVSNLAAVLGMSDKKTILLSCDLRISELHNKFHLSNKKGLSEFLQAKVPLKEVVQKFDKVSNLSIIPSGGNVENPYELLDSKEMKTLIKNLKKYFDYIVIDTPPVDLVSDAFILAGYSDITLFVCKSEVSKKSFVENIDSFVKKYEIKNAGFILHSLKKRYMKQIAYNKEYMFHKSR